MKRLEMGPSRFAVSKPGYDVTTAAEGDLMIDFLNGSYAGILYAGTVLFTAGGWTTSNSETLSANDTQTYSYTFTFGTTYSRPPHATWGCSSAYLNSGGTLWIKNCYRGVQTVNTGGANAYLWTYVWALVSTTSITFNIFHAHNLTSDSASATVEYRMDFHYAIFQA